MHYSFLSPQQVIFGWGRRAELPKLAASIGRRAFFISGSRTLEKSGDIPALIAALQATRLEVIRFGAPSHEPEVADVDALTDQVLAHRPNSSDLVIAVGGGSAIDLAKAVAAMTTNRHGTSVVDFLEGVGRGLTIDQPPLPMIAVPTTAGTGTEATKNAVISCYDPPFKKSLRSDRLIPRCVLIDPELTVTLPATTTSYTGMDAITQLIESYISRRSAPIPRALCEQGLELALPAIRRVVADGSDRSARTAMSHAAFLSGLALANSGLGLAHGVAAALGVQCRVPHGLACAVMLPAALRFNLRVCQTDIARLARRTLGARGVSCFGVARPGVFDGRGEEGQTTPFAEPQGVPPDLSDEFAALTFIEVIEQVCREVQIPVRLRDLGVRQDLIPALVVGSHGNSLSGNPRDVSDEELRHLLEGLW